VKEKLIKDKAATHAALSHITSETPFNKRHECWFCGEPNQYVFNYLNPLDSQFSKNKPSSQLSLPSCKECYLVAKKSMTKAKHEGLFYSIWTIKLSVKKYLFHHYGKDLAIGINWTKKELEESEFEQGNFAGFQRSAWFMFELAKGRVNYVSWPLTVDGVTVLDEYEQHRFNFDDVVYPNVEQAIHHYADSLSLNFDYFRSVLELFGYEHFAKAVRFCRLLVADSAYERQQALRQLRIDLKKLNKLNHT